MSHQQAIMTACEFPLSLAGDNWQFFLLVNNFFLLFVPVVRMKRHWCYSRSPRDLPAFSPSHPGPDTLSSSGITKIAKIKQNWSSVEHIHLYCHAHSNLFCHLSLCLSFCHVPKTLSLLSCFLSILSSGCSLPLAEVMTWLWVSLWWCWNNRSASLLHLCPLVWLDEVCVLIAKLSIGPQSSCHHLQPSITDKHCFGFTSCCRFFFFC